MTVDADYVHLWAVSFHIKLLENLTTSCHDMLP